MKCNLCPRKCNADRKLKYGYCGMGEDIRVARTSLHYWEEPCISGKNGSGTIFFSGCTLRCVFCQNYEIAAGKKGDSVTINELADKMLWLQDEKANNINLVTPSHYTPQIIESIKIAKNNGLRIPIVYNTSGYEQVDTIRQLEGLVDIYLPDFKYVNSDLSKKYSKAEDYFIVAKAALEEMKRQIKKNEFFSEKDAKQFGVEEGMMKNGIIVRHLILPGHTKDSKAVIKYLYETYNEDIYISIMNQYTPLKQVMDIDELNRKITKREYDSVVDYAIDLGVTNAFIQEGETASESFIPEF